MLKRTAPLRRTAMRKARKVDKRTPGEKAYYAWLTTQPCVLTGANCEQRHHLRLQALGCGTSLRCADYFALPVTLESHYTLHDATRSTSWALLPVVWQHWERYGLDKIPAEIRKLATVVKEPA